MAKADIPRAFLGRWREQDIRSRECLPSFAKLSDSSDMSIELNSALADARIWLEKQPDVEHGSAHWCALNNFKAFLADISANPSAEGIDRACHALNWHIADQFEWSAQYCKEITFFCESIRRIGKAIERA